MSVDAIVARVEGSVSEPRYWERLRWKVGRSGIFGFCEVTVSIWDVKETTHTHP